MISLFLSGRTIVNKDTGLVSKWVNKWVNYGVSDGKGESMSARVHDYMSEWANE